MAKVDASANPQNVPTYSRGAEWSIPIVGAVRKKHYSPI